MGVCLSRCELTVHSVSHLTILVCVCDSEKLSCDYVDDGDGAVDCSGPGAQVRLVGRAVW